MFCCIHFAEGNAIKALLWILVAGILSRLSWEVDLSSKAELFLLSVFSDLWFKEAHG